MQWCIMPACLPLSYNSKYSCSVKSKLFGKGSREIVPCQHRFSRSRRYVVSIVKGPDRLGIIECRGDDIQSFPKD